MLLCGGAKYGFVFSGCTIDDNGVDLMVEDCMFSGCVICVVAVALADGRRPVKYTGTDGDSFSAASGGVGYA